MNLSSLVDRKENRKKFCFDLIWFWLMLGLGEWNKEICFRYNKFEKTLDSHLEISSKPLSGKHERAPDQRFKCERDN